MISSISNHNMRFPGSHYFDSKLILQHPKKRIYNVHLQKWLDLAIYIADIAIIGLALLCIFGYS